MKEQQKSRSFFKNEKYADFIADFEDKWLQYASAEQRMKAFFKNSSNAKFLFNKWQSGEDLFAKEKLKAFSK